jgi:hypothetical protein
MVFVDPRDRAPATGTLRRGFGFKMNVKRSRLALEPANPEAFPEREAGHIIAHENGGFGGCLVAQTVYPVIAVLPFYGLVPPYSVMNLEKGGLGVISQ